MFEVVRPELTEKQRAASMDVLQPLTEYTIHLAGPPGRRDHLFTRRDRRRTRGISY